MRGITEVNHHYSVEYCLWDKGNF